MKEIILKHWLETFKASTFISCTSLVTHIAGSIGALDGQDVTYISTPHIGIDEHYLMQGHHLKYCGLTPSLSPSLKTMGGGGDRGFPTSRRVKCASETIGRGS